MAPLTEQIGRTYDEMPYSSYAFGKSAPEHLRVVAYLFGLDAPAPANARVLELGCAAGGNLIPFAVRHPQAETVGIDLSAVQIDAGRRAVEAMGLDNVRLIQGSIADLDEGLGQFDYIVCHGVYSWVPEDVRAAILSACSRLLTPQGVAYISYNTYPGWKAKEIVRDAMLLRAGSQETPQMRLAYGRGMVEFLHEKSSPGSLLSKVMADNIDTIRTSREDYLAHEFIELCNAPCYFRDFVARARESGLEYLGDASVSNMFASNYGAEVAPALLNECGGDQVMLEQLFDFLVNRCFRQTLLVHPAQASKVRYRLDHERIANLCVAGYYTPQDEAMTRWTAVGGTGVNTPAELNRRVIQTLSAAWPSTVPVSQLTAGLTPDEAAQVVSFVCDLVVGSAVSFRREAVAARPADARPEVRASLRRLAGMDGQPVHLFNEWHQPVTPGVLERFVLARMDGSVDEAQLGRSLAVAVGQGEIELTRNGEAILDPDAIAASTAALASNVVQWAARNALLAPMDASAGPSQPAPAATPKRTAGKPAAGAASAPPKGKKKPGKK